MKSKKLILALVIAAALAAAWAWLTQQPKAPEVSAPQPPSDTTEAISQDLETIDVGDLDAEFEAIDQDLQGL